MLFHMTCNATAQTNAATVCLGRFGICAMTLHLTIVLTDMLVPKPAQKLHAGCLVRGSSSRVQKVCWIALRSNNAGCIDP